MCKMDLAKCSNFFPLVFLIIFIHLCASAPLNLTENAYTQFVAELSRNKCSMPSEVHLPFDTSKANDFDYLSSYLELCQKTESAKRNKEAVVLCKEIFDNIRNISCNSHPSLPDISEDLSSNVCQDIGVLKDSVPENDKSLLKRLTDTFLCDIMCDSEFEKACQVLLWSFKVQKRIASVASAQKPEHTSELQNDLNGEDSEKLGNAADENVPPEINPIDPKNEKNNVEEAEDGNKVVEPSEIAEVPQPRNLEDPGQSLIINEQEKPIPDDKGAVLGNQTVPNPKGRDSIVASSRIELTSTLLQTSPGVQTSKSGSEVPPSEETTPGDSDGQNGNKKTQGNQVDKEEVNANELPQDASVKVGVDEAENKDVNTIHDEIVHAKTDKDVLSQDIPNTVTGDTIVKADPSSTNDVPPNDSRNEKTPNNAALFKVQSNATHDDKLGKKVDSPTTSSQAIKSTTKVTVHEQSNTEVQDTTPEQMEVSKAETKADKPQPDSVAGNADTQNRTQTVHDVEPTEQKFPKVPPPAEKPDNAGPSGEKLPENIELSSSAAAISESLPETSTKTVAAIEEMEVPNERRPPAIEDHYGDQENTEDDEYSRAGPDYGAGLYEVSKSKDVPTAAREPIIAPQNGKEFPARFGQDIQMISSFPEQEDGHFFFYFLSIVLILMAGYLLFHNKQKIIALIVEGRHERNRRSHRVGYKKLETK